MRWISAVPLVLIAVVAAPGAAQGVASPASDMDEAGRSRGRTALHGAVLGAALAATPVAITSREPGEDVGIAILLGLASGGATGAMLPLPSGTRRNPWKGGLVGLAAGSIAGGLTLALAWNDPSIEFGKGEKLAVGAVAGGAVGLIVGAVVGGGSGLSLAPSLAAPGRWTGSVTVPLRLIEGGPNASHRRAIGAASARITHPAGRTGLRPHLARTRHRCRTVHVPKELP